MTKKEFIETILKFHNYTPTEVRSHREQDFGVGWTIKALSNDITEFESKTDRIHIEMPSFNEALCELFEYLHSTNIIIVLPE